MNGLFTPRHPLDGAISAGHGRGANHVQVLPSPVVLSVAALPGHEAALRAALEPHARDLRDVGPGEWLVVSTTADADFSRSVQALAGGHALVTEQGSGRTVMRISGPDCRAILAKCTPVDLHPDVFAEGRSTNTLFNHVGANLARLGPDEFEISVMRSFAVFAFEELMEMGLEFGLTAGFAT